MCFFGAEFKTQLLAVKDLIYNDEKTNYDAIIKHNKYKSGLLPIKE